MKKLLLLLLAVLLILGFAVSCGDDTGNDDTDLPEVSLDDFTEHVLTITEVTAGEGTKPGLAGEDLALLKSATVLGSFMDVTYLADRDKAFGCGSIGLTATTEGPVIHGDGSGKKQTVRVLVDDIKDLIEEDKFVFNLYNGAENNPLEVVLYIAKEGYEPPPNEFATEGATKIVVPLGGKPAGKGDVSKYDVANIIAASATATLKLYFETKAGDGYDVGELNRKLTSSPWTTTKIVDKLIHTGKVVEVPIATIQTSLTAVENKAIIEFNLWDGHELVYAEIVP